MSKMQNARRRLLPRMRTALGSLTVAVVLMCAAGEAYAQSPEAQAQQLFSQGFSALKAGDARNAALLFERGLQLAPQNPIAAYFLGESYVAQGRNEEAKRQYYLSLSIESTGKYAEAAKARLKSLEAPPPAVKEVASPGQFAVDCRQTSYNHMLQSASITIHLDVFSRDKVKMHVSNDSVVATTLLAGARINQGARTTDAQVVEVTRDRIRLKTLVTEEQVQTANDMTIDRSTGEGTTKGRSSGPRGTSEYEIGWVCQIGIAARV